MDERVMQLRIGLMVLVVGMIIVILLIMFGGQHSLVQMFQSKQVFYIQFPQAPGVTVDTPVLKSGIRIGRVTRVRLADEITDRDLPDDVGVVVTVEIDSDRKVFSDEVCRIKRNLLGDSVLEFVRVQGRRGLAGPESEATSIPVPVPVPPGAERLAPPPGVVGASFSEPATPEAASPETADPDAKPREVIQSGAWLRGEVQADPIQVVGNLEQGLAETMRSVARTSDEIRDFVQKMSGFLGTREELGPKQERLRSILDRAMATMDRMEKLAQSANDIIGDERLKQDVRDTVAQLPLVIQDARNTLNQMASNFQRMEGTIGEVNESLGQVKRFTTQLGQQGPAMMDRLNRSAETLEALMGDMLTLTHALNSQEGSLGRLIHDPELYDNMNQAVANMEDVTRRLRPVVENARVFSDKIARHPELLGVRGALEQSPGTKGVPRLSELGGGPPNAQATQYPRFFQPQ